MSEEEHMVVVVDSNGVRSGRVDPNREVFEEEGFLVVDFVKCEITAEQAAALISEDSSPDDQRDFLSGPVVAVLLKRENAYSHFQTIRNDVDDCYWSIDPWTTLRDKSIFFPQPAVLERTLVILKPEYSSSDETAILELIEKEEFVVVGKLARLIGPEVAKEIFNESKDDVDFITSEVSLVLVLEKMGAIDEWMLLMGPADPLLAKAVAPNTIRAKLGADLIHNAVYGSVSSEKAQADISSLFPEPFPIERTLAIIKPDILANGLVPSVMREIADNGFSVLAQEEVFLSQQRVQQLYEEHKEQPYFEALTQYMNGTVCVMILGKPGGLQAWNYLIGPKNVSEARANNPNTLRARYGTDELRNGFHGSTDPVAARKEIDQFFPQISVQKIPTLVEVEDLLNKKPAPRPHVEPKKSLNDVLVDGLTQLCRIKPVGTEAVVWLAEWLLRNNPNKPTVATVELPEDDVDVKEELEKSTDGEKVEIMWAVGGPGSGRHDQCLAIAEKFDFEFIDVSELVRSVESSGTEYGELIKQCKAEKRPIPTHVPVNLIKNALLAGAGKRKFLIDGFPSSMSEAFDFEKRVCQVDKIIYFGCTDKTTMKRIQDQAEDEEIAMMEISAFRENVFPLLDHYSTFGKVLKISTDGPEAVVAQRISKLF
jgi:nucleoside-diphosphate kinase